VPERPSVDELKGFGLAAIMARRGIAADRIGAALGLDLPAGPLWTARNGVTLIGTGPGTWLVQVEHAEPHWLDDLRFRLAALASIADQSVPSHLATK